MSMDKLIDDLVRGLAGYQSSLTPPATKSAARKMIADSIEKIVREAVKEELKKQKK